MPGAFASMWRLVKLCYRSEPRLVIGSLLIGIAAGIPRPLTAVWLSLLTDGVHRQRPVLVFAATGAIALSICLIWLLAVASERVGRRLRDRLAIALETRVAELQASIGTIEHHERPEYLNRLAVLRQQVFVLDHLYTSVVTTLTWGFQLALVLALLASVDPLLLLLAFFAVPVVVAGAIRPATERRVEEQAAPHRRLAQHLFSITTTPAAGKDIRLAGTGSRLADARTAAWRRWYGPIGRSRALSAGWNAAGWACYALGYSLALGYVVLILQAPPAAVVLVLAAGIQLSDYVSAAVGEVGFIRGVFLDGSRRLAWLEDYARAVSAPGTLPAPERLTRGITLRDVTFRYPESSRPVLNQVDLHLPAGCVVAIVGDNGAGKSTLVKLLAKFYPTTSGRIYVDDVPLDEIATDQWRQRIAGAFQDFAQFEFQARTSVGLGDLPAADDDAAVQAAVGRGHADDVLAHLPNHLDTQLGTRWPDGVDVSYGQWQKLALARGFMRRGPALVVLDEPTAALDAETEHALFEAFTAAARADGSDERITILVSHRFSTVRMADLIVVLDGNRVAEIGDHHSLMRRDGIYANLYRLQQRSYQT